MHSLMHLKKCSISGASLRIEVHDLVYSSDGYEVVGIVDSMSI